MSKRCVSLKKNPRGIRSMIRRPFVSAMASTFTRRIFPALLLFASMTASAAEHQGRITLFHLNGGVAQRGACVQMSPAIPGTGYGCVWKTNPLYKEITALLMTAHAAGKSCSFPLDASDPDGHAVISWAQCY